MRRGLASLIIGLSLLVATASWAGFTLSRTILDPGRSEALAEQLLENPQVRAALVDRLADAVETQIPPEVPVSRGLIEAGAETAIDDPRVRALIVDGVVRYHRNALEGNAEPVVIDAAALGTVSREVLVNVRPELDPFLPATPSIELELPTTGLNWLARIKQFVDRFTLLAALVAAAGTTLALAVARNRAAVLRRVAFWGYGAAAFWLLVGFAVPWLAGLLSPTSGAIAAAAVDVFFGAMIGPAVVVAIVSTVILLAGFALPMVSRRRGARAIQPRRPGPAAGGGGRPPGTRPGQTPAPLPAAPPLVTRPAPTMVQNPGPGPATAAASPGGYPSGPAAGPAPRQAVDRTSVMPTPTPAVAERPRPSGPPSSPASSPASRPPATTPGPTTTRRVPTNEPTGIDDAAETIETPPRPPAWEEGIGYLDETRS